MIKKVFAKKERIGYTIRNSEKNRKPKEHSLGGTYDMDLHLKGKRY